MLDTVISRGRVVDATQIREASICISEGRVVDVLFGGEEPPAHNRIDALGKLVMPGLVDAHVHFRDPGLTHKEDFSTGSAAAAAGGVTTVMVMPTDNPLTMTPETFADKRALGEGRSHVDFALQAGLGSNTTHVRALADAGAISFELFQTGAPEPLNVDGPADLVRSLEAVREAGGITGVTPGVSSLLARYAELARARHGSARQAFPLSWPAEVEAMGVAQACLAASLAHARIHLRQISTALSVAALRAFRGDLVTSEATPHNLVLDESALLRMGPVAKVAPPLRGRRDLDAVRAALSDRTVDIIATDHAPHTPEEKAAGESDIWQGPGGFPGVQTMLPLALRLVDDGIIDHPALVRACSAAPARIFGLNSKGSLAVGSDADVVICDPAKAMTISDRDQVSKARRSPFDGLRVSATPTLTLLRGTVVMRDGKPVGGPGGRFVRP